MIRYLNSLKECNALKKNMHKNLTTNIYKCKFSCGASIKYMPQIKMPAT